MLLPEKTVKVSMLPANVNGSCKKGFAGIVVAEEVLQVFHDDVGVMICL